MLYFFNLLENTQSGECQQLILVKEGQLLPQVTESKGPSPNLFARAGMEEIK